MDEIFPLVSMSSWTFFFFFPFHHRTPSFKDKVLTACSFFTSSLSANLCKCSSVFTSALLSPEIRTTHLSSQGRTETKTVGDVGDSKTTSNLSRWSLRCLMREGVPTSAQGTFLFFPRYSWGLHLSLTFSAAKKTWKEHEKPMLPDCCNYNKVSA